MVNVSSVVKHIPDSNPLHNVHAEQALLGALLLNNRALDYVIEFLDHKHFSEPVHGKIYQAICSFSEKAKIADPITLGSYFKSLDEQAVQSNYLMRLAEGVVTTVSVKDYGRLIYDLYLRREMLALIGDISENVKTLNVDQSAEEIIEDAEKEIYSLLTTGEKTDKVVQFNVALKSAIERAETAYKKDSHIVGISTGLTDLDRMLGGLHPSDLVIMAGRPSMGKTGLATNIAFNAAKLFLEKKENEGAPVAFFSLEMSSEQLAARILSAESGVPSDHIRRGEVKFDDFPKFLKLAEELQTLPLYIDDTPGLSIVALRNRARRLKRKYNIGLIVIDYLQLITVGGGGESRVQEVSEISRSLKAIAKELDVAVIALSQLSRAVEQREDKKPMLADLRESGTIEQDADVVLFIYREEYYVSRKQPQSGTEKHMQWIEQMNQVHNRAELIIAKQRHGPIGNVSVFYDGRLVKFGNIAKANYT